MHFPLPRFPFMQFLHRLCMPKWGIFALVESLEQSHLAPKFCITLFLHVSRGIGFNVMFFNLDTTILQSYLLLVHWICNNLILDEFNSYPRILRKPSLE